MSQPDNHHNAAPRAPTGRFGFQHARVLKATMRECGQGLAPPPLGRPANQIGAARSRQAHGPERLLGSDVTVGRSVLCIVRNGAKRVRFGRRRQTQQTSRTAEQLHVHTRRAAAVRKTAQGGPLRSLFLSTLRFFLPPRRSGWFFFFFCLLGLVSSLQHRQRLATERPRQPATFGCPLQLC